MRLQNLLKLLIFVFITQISYSQTADLSLKLISSGSTQAIYTSIYYRITVKNAGPSTTNNVVARFVLPAQTAYTSANASKGTWDSYSTGNWNIGSLNAGDSAVLNVVLFSLASTNVVAYSQVISSSLPDPDSSPNNNPGNNPVEDDESAVTITPGAAQNPFSNTGGGTNIDLELTCTTSNPETNFNQVVPLVFKIINKGNQVATNVKVKVNLPAGLSYQDYTASGASFDAVTKIWSMSSVPIFGEFSLILNAKVVSGGNQKVSAQVTNQDQTDLDSAPNNYGTSAVEDDEVDINILGLLVDLELSAALAPGTPATINVNDNVTYRVVLFNRGPTRSTNTKVRAFVPAGCQLVSATTNIGEYDSSVGVWLFNKTPDANGNKTGFTVPVNATYTLDLTIKVITAGTIVFTPEVRVCNEPDFDSTPSNNSTNEDDDDIVTFTTGVGNTPKVDLELSAITTKNPVNNGDSVVYSMTIVNKGTANANSVTVSISNPLGITFNAPNVSIGTYSTSTWTIGNININETQTITFRGITAGLTNTVKSFGQVQTASPIDVDSSPGNNTTGNPAEDDEASLSFGPTTAVVVNADLELSMTSNVTSAKVGDAVAYTLTVVNKGPSTATNILIKDYLETGLTLVSTTPSIGTFSSSNWSIPSLTVNSTATITINTTVAAINTTLLHFAQVQSVSQTDPDSNPGNNTNNIPSQDDEAAVTITKTVTTGGNTVDLEVSFSSDKNTLPVYTNILFTVLVTNKGVANATGVSVKYVLPTSMAYSSHLASRGNFDTWNGIWTIGNLNINETVKLEVSLFVLNTNPVTQFVQVQTASPLDIDSTPGNDTNNTPNEDDEALLVLPNTGAPQPKKVDLELTMSSDKTNFTSGSAVAYTLNIKNVGDTIASGVSVKDLLPSGLTFVSAVGGTYAANTGIWTIGSLAINGTSSIVINTTASGTSTITNFAQVVAGTPNDIDSQVNNNSTTSPVEDDEAATNIVPQGTTVQVDLQLTMTANPIVYKIYNNVDFVITLTNTGGTTATGVTVDVPFPTYFVYSGDTKSAGTTLDLYTNTWIVGSIPAGQTKTLTLTLFNLNNSGPIKAFAQVKTASPTDVDSSPGNNTTTTPKEDDEASVTVTPFVSVTRLAKFDQKAQIEIQNLFPNPVDDYLTIEISSKEVQDVEITVFDILGLPVMNETRKLKLGDNQLILETYNLAQGTYIIFTDLKHRQSNPVKFLKL